MFDPERFVEECRAVQDVEKNLRLFEESNLRGAAAS